MLDFRCALRQVYKSPGFVAVAVLTLGLCIGANLTILSVVDAILIRPLPFPEPDRLVVVHNAYPEVGIRRGNATIADYFDRREAIDAFEAVAMYRERWYTIGEGDSTRRVACGEVTPEFFDLLGVSLARGDGFTDTHFDYGGANLVAILTDQYWRDHFGADPDAIGSRITFNSNNAIVCGILPADFNYLSPHIQVYRPLAHHRRLRTSPGRHTALARDFDGQMIARLAKNRTIEEAQTQIDVLNEDWLAADAMGQSVTETGYHSWVAPLHSDHVASVKPMLLLVQAGVACLLLIGCVNLASLQLVRGSGRAKEVAVRVALGASRRNIVAMFLTESMLIGLLGGAAGAWLGFAGVRLIRALGATSLPLGTVVAFDGRIAIACLGLALAVGAVMALPIVWINLRSAPQRDLQSESRGGTTGRTVQRLRHCFIVIQIATAFVLLCGAGLLGTSLKRMLDQSPGFLSERVLTGQITLPWMTYRGPETKLPFVRKVLDEVRSLPGVTHAAVSSGLPFTTEGATARTILAEGAAAGSDLRAHYVSSVTPDYWRVLEIPLLQGRYFDDSDSSTQGARPVAIVDEVVARKYWPDGDAIGRRFSTGISDFNEAQSLTVVGIVGSVKQTDLTEVEPLGAVYEPYAHTTDFRLVIRTSIPSSALISAVQRKIREIDPAMPIDDFRPLQTFIDDSLVTRRSPAILSAIFASVALLLAAVGTYGVLSYAVSQRQREIGVRIALGAMPEQIGMQFLFLGLRLLLVGLLLGSAGAWATSRTMQSILFGIPSLHIPTFAATAALMSLVALAACLLPAFRAARIDASVALGNE